MVLSTVSPEEARPSEKPLPAGPSYLFLSAFFRSISFTTAG